MASKKTAKMSSAKTIKKGDPIKIKKGMTAAEMKAYLKQEAKKPMSQEQMRQERLKQDAKLEYGIIINSAIKGVNGTKDLSQKQKAELYRRGTNAYLNRGLKPPIGNKKS